MSANERQVGGSHYAAPTGMEQHWDRVARLNLDYFQGQITKYVERWKLKDGVKDLEKAAHFLQKYLELQQPVKEPPLARALADTNMVQADTMITWDPGAAWAKAQAVTPASFEVVKLVDDGKLRTAEVPGGWKFISAVCVFNGMFSLPIPSKPGYYLGAKEHAVDRLVAFKKIMQDELSEVNDIFTQLTGDASELEVMTALADWLGDIQVYCASEMLRWGIPLNPVLKDIMDSQESKLGEDGKPILKDGKVVKGPNYVAPEPRIRKTLILAGMLPGTMNQHEDNEWQCEGFYGDQTQLYRHRKTRKLVRRPTLAAAYEWFQGASNGTVDGPKAAG